jgi:tripartite-type tricarboxylate transporter receptor subunit TctC
MYVFFAARWLGFYTASLVTFVAIYALYDPAPHTALTSWLKRVVNRGHLHCHHVSAVFCAFESTDTKGAVPVNAPKKKPKGRKPMKKLLKAMALSVMTVAATFAGAQAAGDYPDRPVSVMVSYGAGGATDFQARIVTMVAGNDDLLTQPIVIINKPGAGGRVGWNWFATEAEADGYTLAAYNIPHFIAQSIEGGVKYSADAFEPIANWGSDPAVVVVPKDSPYNSIKELLDYAKENPGKVTLSGAGLFVGHHIAALQIEKAAGVKLAYIPTKGGGAAAMKAVIAGDVVGGINNLSDAFRARESGNVKILAVADNQRNEEFLPDVPTLKEAGYDVDD